MHSKATSGAATLVGLSASVYLSSHSNWATQHPDWAIALYGATAVSALWTMFQFEWFRRLVSIPSIQDEKPLRQAKSSGRGLAVAGDFSGSHLDSSSGPRFIGDSAIKAHLEHQREVAGEHSPQSFSSGALKVEAKALLPVLSLDITKGSVDVSEYMVSFANTGGANCFLISVHNERAAERGEEAVVADAISASIALSPFASSRITRVDHACWVDEDQNEISLRPGETAHVLIGIRKKDEWLLYENPKRYPVEWPSIYHDLDEISLPFYANLRVIGEISILSHKHDKTITLASRKFVITVDNQGFSANVGWENET